MDEIRQYLPDLYAALTSIAAVWGTPSFQDVLQDLWPAIDEVTIDHGILEHSGRVAVVPASFGWADVGTWHNLGEIAAQDGVSGSVLGAGTISLDSYNTLVAGNGGQKIIALLGVNDAIVVDTDDALLICARERAQDVRLVVEELKRRGMSSLV
jgi:mannose-1-phosphate guanylyltransferase